MADRVGTKSQLNAVGLSLYFVKNKEKYTLSKGRYYFYNYK